MKDIKQSTSMVKNTTEQQSTGNECPDCIAGYKHFEHMEQIYRVPCRTCSTNRKEYADEERV